MGGNKGQLAIFIFMGVLLLVMVGIFVVLSQEKIITTDLVADQGTPISRFMDACLQEVGRDGLVRMGMQGGYITLPESYLLQSSYIQDLANGPKTPLWHYQGRNQVPTISQMETELESYVNDHIALCANDIKNQDFITGASFASEPASTVILGQEAVSIKLNYSIVTTNGNVETTNKQFFAQLPINFNEIIDSATLVLNRHNSDLFLDRTTLNMISLDPDIPIGDIRFSCDDLVWSQQEVQTKLQDTLTYTFPRVRIKNSNHLPFKEPIAVYDALASQWSLERIESEGGLPDNLPRDFYEYSQQYWDLQSDLVKDLSIGFSYYPSYGMRLQANPSDGDRLSAKAARSGSEYLKYLCLNTFHFTYDIEFPAKVSIYSEKAFGGDGYMFSFGVPVQIDHNIPSRATPWFATADALDTDITFCETTTGENLIVNVKNPFAEFERFVNDVTIRYDCQKYYCDLGATNTEQSYGIPELHTELPVACANGFFIAEKEGYLRVKKQIVDPSGVVEIEMIPLTKKRIVVAALSDSPYDSSYIASVYLKSSNFDYDAFATYPAINGVAEIEIIDAPEDYEMQVLLMANGNLVGGYVGNISITATDLEQEQMLIYPVEWPGLVNGGTSEQRIALYKYLDENPDGYRDSYYPTFK